MKNKYLLSLLFFTSLCHLYASKTTIYLIPGQGSDERLFKNMEITEDYVLEYIKYELPHEGSSMSEYACQLSQQIDTHQKFILLGVSLGGMLATEMADFLSPEKVIIIASAKQTAELPRSFNFQKKVPLYKLANKRNVKLGAKILQPIVEPDRRKESETFKAMISDKNPEFLLRTMAMIMRWERDTYAQSIVHIHGSRDRTIPVQNVKYDYLIDKGSHMMTLTRSKEISNIINNILKDS